MIKPKAHHPLTIIEKYEVKKVNKKFAFENEHFFGLLIESVPFLKQILQRKEVGFELF